MEAPPPADKEEAADYFDAPFGVRFGLLVDSDIGFGRPLNGQRGKSTPLSGPTPAAGACRCVVPLGVRPLLCRTVAWAMCACV